MTNSTPTLIQACDYALINPLQVDRSYWEDLESLPVVPNLFKSQPHLFPILLNLRQLSPSRLTKLAYQADSWLQDGADVPLLSALIQSRWPTEKLLQHLAEMMRFWHAGEYRVLRYYDPRVFRHLCWLLDTNQMHLLLGPIRTWAWCELNGTWHTQAGCEELMPARPLPLSLSQRDTLLRIEEINLSIGTLKDQNPELLSDPHLPNKLNDYLQRAEEIEGLLAATDRRLYAEQALRFHPDIHHHLALKTRLDLTRNGKMSYVGACADLDDHHMNRLITELTAMPKDCP